MGIDQNNRRLAGDAGASLVEYALLVSLITLVCVGAVMYFQEATTNTLDKSATAIRDSGG